MKGDGVCPQCKGMLYRFYIRVWGDGKTRIFKAANLMQCERCKTFFASKPLNVEPIPLNVEERNGRFPKGEYKKVVDFPQPERERG